MYQERDVVLLNEGWGGASMAYVITGQKPNGGYSAIVLGSSQKRVGLPANSIRAKIAVLAECDLDDLFVNLREDTLGVQPTLRENDNSVEARQRLVLQTIKPGDPITLKIGAKTEVCTFSGMLPRGTKFVFAATRPTGGTYKWKASHIVP
jgi:hypothetical protein